LEGFFPGREIVDISRGLPKVFFPGGAADIKFHFTNSTLREKHFSTKMSIRKYHISKSMGPWSLSPLSDAHECS